MPRPLGRRTLFYAVVGLHYLLIVVLWNASGQQKCKGTDPRERGLGLLLTSVATRELLLDENVSRRLSTAKPTIQRKGDQKTAAPKSAKRDKHDKVEVKTTATKSSNEKQKTQEKVTGKPSTSFSNKSVIVSTTTARPTNCSGCFHSEFATLVDQPDLCQVVGKNTVDIVFLVLTAVQHTSQRNAIRSTWASVTKNNTGSFRHVFMAGTTTDAKRMRALEEEGRHFRDVVVSGFHDSYKNLTLKTISSLRWLTTRCHHARFFLKVDDDVWVNPQVVLSLMNNHSLYLQGGIGGQCATSNRVNRYNKSKWFVPVHLHPQDKYAPYCYGFAYGGSRAVAEKVVAVSKDVPFFQFEDVYVGMCLQRLGLGVRTFKGFKNYASKDPCQQIRSPQVPTILSISPKKMFDFWNAKCPS